MEQQEPTMEAGVAPIVYLMKNYADYNLWANATLVNWLRTKPANILAKEVPSSFNTIKATITHILSAQQYWLTVIKGNKPGGFNGFEGTLQEAFVELVEQSDEFADYIKEMTEDTIGRNIEVINPWFRCDFQIFEYIMQVINHGTYHRGQIITMGRNLGFTDAPMTDYNVYNIHGK